MKNLKTFEEYDEDWGGSGYELKSSKKLDKKVKNKEDKKSQKKLKKSSRDAALRMILY